MAKKIQPPGPQRSYPKATTTGKIPFQYPQTGLQGKTAYWLWGDLTTTTKTPLIVLHGGPGVPHNYLLSLALIHEDHGIPVVMYDQIGAGQSTHFRDRKGDTDFWIPQLFMAELDNVKAHLGIEQFDLLGRSWGGMLAGQYAIETQPKGLRKLIIADSPSDMEVWVEASHRLRAALPQDVRDTLEMCEKEGKTDTPEYERAVQIRGPQEVLDSFAGLAEDNTVYETMNGPSEFFVIGSLKTWSISERLKEITEKAAPGGLMVVNGYYDEAQDDTTRAFFEGSSCRTKWLRYALSSHFPHLEESEAFLVDLGKFLMS